jgi:hypothetical protein
MFDAGWGGQIGIALTVAVVQELDLLFQLDDSLQ